MSAQCYTNKRRILAEASVTKTQYPGSIGLNNNPIYASINCNPNFNELAYLIKLCCFRSNPIQKSEPQNTLLILDGLHSRIVPLGILDASNALTFSYEIIDGGNS